MRASDAERDAVVGRLNQAVGEGRLTMDEFSGRLELAYAARTRGDLNPLLRDLPADAGGAVPATTSGTAVVVSRGSRGKGARGSVFIWTPGRSSSVCRDGPSQSTARSSTWAPVWVAGLASPCL